MLKPFRILTFTATALAAAVGASSATASVANSPFADFQYCPYNDPSIVASRGAGCIYNVTESGSLTIGSTALPITPPVVLQGAVKNLGPSQLVDAVGAPTLSSPPSKVPGGLLGIANPAPNWPFPLWQAFWNIVNSVNDVSATLELTAPVQATFSNALATPVNDPTAYIAQLSLRAKLSNPFLGDTCYIGSAQNPITITLINWTTNPPPPNQPISGNKGTLDFVWVDQTAGINYLKVSDNTMVDNAFAVPAASGCGNIAFGLPILTQVLDALVSGAVNLKVGLPSAAGKNTVIMTGTSEIASARFVRPYQ